MNPELKKLKALKGQNNYALGKALRALKNLRLYKNYFTYFNQLKKYARINDNSI